MSHYAFLLHICMYVTKTFLYDIILNKLYREESPLCKMWTFYLHLKRNTYSLRNFSLMQNTLTYSHSTAFYNAASVSFKCCL